MSNLDDLARAAHAPVRRLTVRQDMSGFWAAFWPQFWAVLLALLIIIVYAEVRWRLEANRIARDAEIQIERIERDMRRIMP